MFYQTWGSGKPVIALHPLALESTVFTGVAGLLEGRGLRTLAADLPGFGQTEADDAPLTAARLAKPVVQLARSLETPPIVLGMSLGARVALEAALADQSAFRGLALVVPYLPWIDNRWGHGLAHFISPALAERVPLELAWPLLHRLTSNLDKSTFIEHDWLARASVRVAYYLSCPATRRHLVSATKEMMLDPADGPDAIWQRMSQLKIPVVFLWAERDRLIPAAHANYVLNRFPRARQMHLPCSGHFVHGRHYHCFNNAMALAVQRVVEDSAGAAVRGDLQHERIDGVEICACLAERAGDVLEEVNMPKPKGTPFHARPATPVRTRASHGETSPPSATADRDGGGAHSSTRRLSGEDALFVYGETVSMPMHTIGTMLLDPSSAPDGRFDLARLEEVLASRLHKMPPYRQRLVEVPLGLGRPLLVDDPDFRIANHLHYAHVEDPGTLRELARFVGSVAGTPLDRSRPLWEMWYVEGLEGGRVALVTKMHHCMFDGASGADQMANLLDVEPQTPAIEDVPLWRPQPLPSRVALAAEALVPSIPDLRKLASLTTGTVTGFLRRAAARGRESSMIESVRSAIVGAPRTRFTRSITSNRSVAYASAGLDDVKAIKRAYSVTVNDVVLAACALALQRYLRDDDDLPADYVLCAVPVSIKSDAEKKEFSNKVSMMTVRLPIRIDDPEALVRAVHDATEAAKREFFAAPADLLVDWLDLTLPLAIGIGARLYSDLGLADWLPSSANLIVSNMAGPPIPLYLAGARVEAIYPMGPVAHGTGLNITVLSNMNRIDVGLLACRETVPHLWRIAEGVEEAVRELKRAARSSAAA